MQIKFTHFLLYYHFFRVTENIFINFIKYSLPKTAIEIIYSKNDECINLLFTNLSYSLSENDLENIYDAHYSGNNINYFKKYNKGLGFPEGRGLGLGICKELLEPMNGKIHIKQTNDLSYDEKKSIELYKYEIRETECMKFNVHLVVNIYK